jgi:uncharacterized protein (TIGR02246 family)
MSTRVLCLAVLLLSSMPAFADATAEAKAHTGAFMRACLAGDVKAVVDLYTDDAVLVWPGQGDEARGKDEIRALISRYCTGERGAGLVLKSMEAVPLGDSHIAARGHFESSVAGPEGRRVTTELRATEVLVKTGAGWRYVSDHASVGVPARPATPRRQRRTR